MKKNIIVLIVTIMSVCGGIVLLLVGVFKNKTVNNQVNEPISKNESKYFKLDIDNVDYNDLYLLINSTKDSSVYSSTDISASELKTDQIIYNTLVFIYKHGQGYVKTGKINSSSGDEVTASYVTIADAFDVAKKIYYVNTSGLSNEMPKFISSKYSQTAEMTLGKVGDDDVYYYECSSNTSDWGGDCSYINKGNQLTDVIFTEIKSLSNPEEIILYDKTILNVDIDFSDTHVGTISRFDNTGKISIDDKFKCSNSLIECLYNKYPNYFTIYKHIFKKVTDGDNAYYQYEYSFPMPQDSFKTAHIGKLKVSVPSYFQWCEITTDRDEWSCWAGSDYDGLTIFRDEDKTDITEILKSHIDVIDANINDLDIKNITINGVKWTYASVNYNFIENCVHHVYVTKYGKETYVLMADYPTDNNYNENITKKIVESLKFVS